MVIKWVTDVTIKVRDCKWYIIIVLVRALGTELFRMHFVKHAQVLFVTRKSNNPKSFL